MNPAFMFSGFCRGCNIEGQKYEIIPFDYTIKFYFIISYVSLFYSFSYYTLDGPELLSWYGDCKLDGQEIKSRGVDFYRTRPERSCGPTAFCTVDTGPLFRA